MREVWPERCEHTDCNYQNRLEYCSEEARDPSGWALIAAGELEALLYEGKEFVRGGFKCSDESERYSFERTFSYLEGDLSTGNTLIDRRIKVAHSLDKHFNINQYRVTTSWCEFGKPDASFIVGYSFEYYPEGPVQAVMTEPVQPIESLKNGMIDYQSRDMTAYDFEQLAELAEQARLVVEAGGKVA